MSFFSELVSTLFERRYQKLLSKEAEGRSTKDLARALLGSIGEVSGMAMAHTVLDRYAAMNADEKLAFFEFMTHELEIDPEEVIASLKAYKTNSNKDTYRSFAIASEPKRQELARRLNQVPGATGQLVQLRYQGPARFGALRCGSQTPVRLLVQPRFLGLASDKLEQPRRYFGKNHCL